MNGIASANYAWACLVVTVAAVAWHSWVMGLTAVVLAGAALGVVR